MVTSLWRACLTNGNERHWCLFVLSYQILIQLSELRLRGHPAASGFLYMDNMAVNLFDSFEIDFTLRMLQVWATDSKAHYLNRRLNIKPQTWSKYWLSGLKIKQKKKEAFKSIFSFFSLFFFSIFDIAVVVVYLWGILSDISFVRLQARETELLAVHPGRRWWHVIAVRRAAKISRMTNGINATCPWLKRAFKS